MSSSQSVVELRFYRLLLESHIHKILKSLEDMKTLLTFFVIRSVLECQVKVSSIMIPSDSVAVTR